MVNNHYDSLVESIVKSPGLVMLVGPSDSGKTTMAKYLLSKLCLFRSKVGFVDSDVGQSTIGPPGTIGAAIFNRFDPQKDWERQAQSTKFYFIGAFSPPGHVLELLLGLKKMVDYLKQLNCDIIIIDTRRPHLIPMYNIYSHLVYAVTGSDVTTVIVNGQVLMEGRVLTTLDLDEVMASVNRITQDIRTWNARRY